MKKRRLQESQFAPTAEEEAVKINDQTGAGFVTDQAFWEKQGIRTGEELAKSVLGQTYSDYYKDINGRRPRGWPGGKSLMQMSVEEIEKLIDDLDEQATDEWYEERHQMDQDLGEPNWADDMIAAIQNNPEDIPGEWLEYEQAPGQQGMGRRPAGTKSQRRMETKVMNKRQLSEIIAELVEGYNSMSPAGKSLAQRAKRQFAKDYPEVKVGIDGREGWITVDGKKAVNMSQASGSPMQMDDVIDKMKQAYLDHPVQEAKRVRVTKRQLVKLVTEAMSPAVELTEVPDEAAVSAAWPDGVLHNGNKVFDTFYGDNAAAAQDFIEAEGYSDAQEGYLGYDPESDVFVMGFDAFEEEYDEYGNADNAGGMMQSVLVLIDSTGRPLEIMTAVPGGLYPEGINAVKKSIPAMIDVRLD